MSVKSLKIDSIDLDLENPRITLASSQRDAMQKIINEQGVKLINLAESIAANGLSPMDRFLVLRSDRQGKFIVIEGNRRVLAMKLLKNPSLVNDLEMTDAFRRRLLSSGHSFDVKKIEPLDCYEVADRAEGIEWIIRRHTGQNSGRGIVDWSGLAAARFRGRDPGLQALDFVLEHGDLDQQVKDQIVAKFPISTLERLIGTPSVRSAIGFEIKEGKLRTELPADEALKPLKRLVLDLATDEINVTKVKSKKQQEDYVGRLKPVDRPDLARKSGLSLSVDSMTDKDFMPVPALSQRKARGPKPTPRTAIVPRGCKLNVTVHKISGIYEELKTLQLTKHVHAIGVLFRVFLEMSVDDYMERSKLPFKYHDQKNNRDINRDLKTKVKDTAEHMVKNGANAKDLRGVTSAMSDPNHPFAIDTLHAYVHSRFFTPIDRHLVTAWDNAEPFFGIIWP